MGQDELLSDAFLNQETDDKDNHGIFYKTIGSAGGNRLDHTCQNPQHKGMPHCRNHNFFLVVACGFGERLDHCNGDDSHG